MTNWEKLAGKKNKTAMEVVLVHLVEAAHAEDPVGKYFSRETINDTFDAIVKEALEKESKQPEVKTAAVSVESIFLDVFEEGKHLTKVGKPELPELNERLVAAGFEAIDVDERDELFEELTEEE